MSDPKVIYLGPACEAETGDGRTWAEDNPWPDCECGHRPVQYVHGETFERMKAERDALQLMLNNRDDLDDQLSSLEQRRYAEQQACQSAERRVEELEKLLSLARLYVRDLASSLENACEFFEGDEEDDPQATEECEEARRFAMRIEAALNPTAEAVIHE